MRALMPNYVGEHESEEDEDEARGVMPEPSVMMRRAITAKMQDRVEEFDLSMLPEEGATIQVIGPIGHGKTTTGKNLLYGLRNRIVRGMMVCGTNQGYDAMWPSTMIIPPIYGDVDKMLMRVLEGQKYDANRQLVEPSREIGPALVYFDDAGAVAPLFKGANKNSTLNQMAVQCRHYRIFIITLNQTPTQLGEDFRTLSTISIFVGSKSINDLHMLRQKYFQGVLFDNFAMWFKSIVDKDHKLVLMNGRFYRWRIRDPRTLPPFRLGSDYLWHLHETARREQRKAIKRELRDYERGMNPYLEREDNAERERTNRARYRRGVKSAGFVPNQAAFQLLPTVDFARYGGR